MKRITKEQFFQMLQNAADTAPETERAKRKRQAAKNIRMVKELSEKEFRLMLRVLKVE